MATKTVTDLTEMTDPVITDLVYIVDDAIGTPTGKKCTVGNLLQRGLQMTSVPATAASAGVSGQIAKDSNYFYVCVATNTWKRVAISTWS
jgi:hypothetical protein